MKRYAAMVLILCVLSMAWSCNKSVNEQAEFAKKIATMMCKKEFECCGRSMKEKHYTSVEGCVDYRLMASADNIYYFAFADNYAWDGANADKCLRYYEKYTIYGQSCTTDLVAWEAAMTEEDAQEEDELYAACDQLVVGAGAVGDKCYPEYEDYEESYASQCVAGAYCDADLYVCVRIPRVGESCKESDRCYSTDDRTVECKKEYLKDGAGEYLVDENGDRIVQNAVCTYLPVAGEDCLWSGFSCEADRGLYCDKTYKTDSEGNTEYDPNTGDPIYLSVVCKALPDIGGDCSKSGGRCLNKLGEDLYCAYVYNQEGDTLRVCKEYPKAGEDCSDTDECKEGLYCKQEEETTETGTETVYRCRALVQENGTCEHHTDCVDGLFCTIDVYGAEVTTGSCVKKFDPLTTCLEDAQCASGDCALLDDGSIGTEEDPVYYCKGSLLVDRICVAYDYEDDYYPFAAY